MQAFTTSHKDALITAAASILFNEDLTTVKDKVAKLKVGSVTNFGTVKSISDNAIEFKAADTGVTRITLNQRKMGSKDFVLDKLTIVKEEVELTEGNIEVDIDTSFDSAKEKEKWIAAVKAKGMTAKFSGSSTLVSGPKAAVKALLTKHYGSKKDAEDVHPELKEDVDLEEAKEDLDINKVLAYAKKIGGDVKGSTIDFGQGSVIKVSVAGDKIKFDGGKSSGIETFKSSAAAIAALGKGIDEEADLDEANISRDTVKGLRKDLKKSVTANDKFNAAKKASDAAGDKSGSPENTKKVRTLDAAIKKHQKGLDNRDDARSNAAKAASSSGTDNRDIIQKRLGKHRDELQAARAGGNAEQVKYHAAQIQSLLTRMKELQKEDVDLDEAKAADPANLRSIIANHTALLRKADKPEAKEFHKVAIANAKEKLKSLGEEVELEESYYTPTSHEALKAFRLITVDMDDIADLVQVMKGLSTYYVDFGKQNEQPDSIAFGKHLTAAYNIIKDWH